ncbi:alpha/beta fold hydrolase [Nocardia amamiensis]|uniref:Alpha/beta fold hydrolase n=1 Tax=Nocardia amamiensis TaxID=404578 RepID=A0ABS0CKL6_9NOCA|nr:alpha/beta fold hydrolase [Nocardia amamiensis]
MGQHQHGFGIRPSGDARGRDIDEQGRFARTGAAEHLPGLPPRTRRPVLGRGVQQRANVGAPVSRPGRHHIPANKSHRAIRSHHAGYCNRRDRHAGTPLRSTGSARDSGAGHNEPVSVLNVHRFGPTTGPVVLALHGVTGHGKRWEDLATRHLPDVRVLAPDLRGHGRSTSLPPWNFETIVTDLVELLAAEADGPVVVVAHSFGGACALHLAHRHPDLVRKLVLLDPAIALEPEWLNRIALSTLVSADYDSVEEARQDKLDSGWSDVEPRLLEAELTEHLMPTADGRFGWRMSLPAINSYWGQLARHWVLPPRELSTVLVQAMKVDPPFVTPEFRAALTEHMGASLTVLEWNCDHMVAQAYPAETGDLVRSVL